MREVYITGVSTTAFGKHFDKGIKDLTAEAVRSCLADAGLSSPEQLQAAWFSNSSWGESKGQSCIRGQVALRPLGIDRIPITNVENACASGSTALHAAWTAVASGLIDVAIAVGVEKLYHPNKMAVFAGFLSGIDIENCLQVAAQLQSATLDEAAITDFRARYPESKRSPRSRTLLRRARQLKDAAVVAVLLGERLGYDTAFELARMSSGDHSPFMDVYASVAREHMRTYGSTVEQLAAIAAKNHRNGSLNPNAQYRVARSVSEVLADRLVSYPLTRAMCAPIGDGAAAAILCSTAAMRRLEQSSRGVTIRASVLGSGSAADNGPSIGTRLSRQAYEQASVGPDDIDVAEVHDATAFGELAQTEYLGFCAAGEGGVLAARGDTALGGRIPLNPSGGLIARGHPVGASGLAQVHELVTQLRGEAGKRQVPSSPRLALAENGGGYLGHEEAAMCIHLLERPAR